MGDSLPRFGRVDLELGEAVFDGEAAAFGEVDFEVPEEEPQPPASSARPVAPEPRVSRRPVNLPGANDATRVVSGDVLSNVTRSSPPPALAQRPTMPVRHDPPSVQSAGSVPSESGVATRDDRVAAMRELYARGDVDAALAVAESVARDMGPDAPDASIQIEIGEAEISDPFGGLILVEEEDDVPAPPHDDGGTAIVSAGAMIPALAKMTSHTGVPEIVKSPAEIATLPIDHRAGFLLAHIDGMQSMEEILDVCAMPENEALELIELLRSMGVIEIR